MGFMKKSIAFVVPPAYSRYRGLCTRGEKLVDSSHGQESYLRVLNGIFISKEYSILEKQKKNLIPKSIVS